MADFMPVVFRKSSPVSANYDWYDIGAGVGYKTFYAAATVNSAATTYFLTTNNNIDGDVTLNSAVAGSDLDFDITLNSPLTVGKGTASINYTSTHPNGVACFVVFTLYHVSGVTETSIGTITTSTNTPAGNTNNRRLAMIPITTEKYFSPGDKLRLSIQNTGGNIYFEPSNRVTLVETITSATIGTDLVLNMSFKIDL